MILSEKISYKLKRLQVRYQTNLLNKVLKSLDQNQQLAYEITKKLILHSGSKTIIAPLSGELFVINEAKEMFIIIEYQEITIVAGNDKNGKHSYTVFLPERVSRDIRNRFNKKAQYNRFLLRKRLMNNIKTNLQTINEKLKNEEVIINRDISDKLGPRTDK